MDHSLKGYLKRKDTDKLLLAQKSLREQERNPYNRYIIDTISQILNERMDHKQKKE